MQNSGIAVSRFISNILISKCKKLGEKMFNKYLLLTNVGVSVSLSGTGDVIEQTYEITSKHKERWDRLRTFNMAASGFTVGIVCHYWYKILDNRMPERTIRVVLKKVLVDQIVFSPVIISVFFLTLGFLEKSDLKTVQRNIIEKGWQLYAAEWFIWPPAQVVNFCFLPTRYRVLYDNTISLGFDTYTSYVVHEDKRD